MLTPITLVGRDRAQAKFLPVFYPNMTLVPISRTHIQYRSTPDYCLIIRSMEEERNILMKN